ncbi:MAG TPA: FliH/SctL family protein [Acidobacteriaceae bacterium]|jgi:flagellar assembly protein FliH|nr:FliH/SctL family protein [Acidobacteriaceae bacterium]
MQLEAAAAIRPMEYPVLGAFGTGGAVSPESAAQAAETVARDEVLTRQMEAVRRQGIEQGRQMEAGESAAWRQECAAELAKATEAFRSSRDTYLAEVEKEVVRLAMAIAERILHRESQLDPLLLSGAVRKALGQLADSTEVRLRVPADQRELWTDVMHLMPGLPLRPKVVSDPELTGCTVVVESNLGMADVSVRAQLEEIARAFFDRAETRREGGIAQEAGAMAAGASA